MHAYKEAVRDRSVYNEPKTGIKYARTKCTTCGFTGSITLRTLLPPEVIDKKFHQKGWSLDPAQCPSCIKEKRAIKQRVDDLPENLPRLVKKDGSDLEDGTKVLSENPTPAELSAGVRGFKIEKVPVKEVVVKALAERDPNWDIMPDIAAEIAKAKETQELVDHWAGAVAAVQPMLDMPPEEMPPVPKPKPTTKKAEQTPMNSFAENTVLRAVSADTHKAAAKMHMLLSAHFDGETGHYEAGWNDERIAQETGLSEIHVSEVREVAYGELKVPDEMVSIRNDLKAIQELIAETMAGAQKEIVSINERMNLLSKSLGFKW